MPSKDKDIEKKKDYVKGDALKGTTPDFSAENFKTKDVMKWSEIKKGHDRIESIRLPGLSTLANKTKLPRYKNQ